MASTASVVAEYYSASAVERAIVFCILDFHEIGDLLYSMTCRKSNDWTGYS
jgi:hypothetical protein